MTSKTPACLHLAALRLLLHALLFSFNSECMHNHGAQNYPLVWAADAADPSTAPGGDGESVVAVCGRLLELMQVMRSNPEGCKAAGYLLEAELQQ